MFLQKKNNSLFIELTFINITLKNKFLISLKDNQNLYRKFGAKYAAQVEVGAVFNSEFNYFQTKKQQALLTNSCCFWLPKLDSPCGPQAKNSPLDCFLHALFESPVSL